MQEGGEELPDVVRQAGPEMLYSQGDIELGRFPVQRPVVQVHPHVQGQVAGTGYRIKKLVKFDLIPYAVIVRILI